MTVPLSLVLLANCIAKGTSSFAGRRFKRGLVFLIVLRTHELLQKRKKPMKASRWKRGNRSRRRCVYQTNQQWLVQRRKTLRETTQGPSHKRIRLRWHMTFRTPTPEATRFHRPTPVLAHTPDTSTDPEYQSVVNDKRCVPPLSRPPQRNVS